MITPELRALVIADLQARAKAKLACLDGMGSEEDHLEYLIKWLEEHIPAKLYPSDSVGTRG